MSGNWEGLSDNCKTTLARAEARTRNDPLLHLPPDNRAARVVNHALVKQSYFIHQTWFPVSLELKDTEVRAYRTDPVQVRSWPLCSSPRHIKGAWLNQFVDVGYSYVVKIPYKFTVSKFFSVLLNCILLSSLIPKKICSTASDLLVGTHCCVC